MDGEDTGIKCDVEINFLGPTLKTVEKWAADALRRIADQLEKGEYEDGNHEVTDGSGRPIGTVYFDFYEQSEL